MSRCLPLLTLFAAFLGCSQVDVLVRKGSGVEVGDEAVLAVAPTRLLLAFPDVLRHGGVFEDNLTVAHLQLSGGYIVSDSEMGMQYRSKEVELRAAEQYGTQARDWLDQTVREVLTEEELRFVALEAVDPAALTTPKRTKVRGSGPFDRRDNQNLPRFELQPQPLSEENLGSLPELNGAQLLLVPTIVYYYSHNGGWFVGQSLGCAGGARARVLWTVYDTKTGVPLHWGDVEARRVDDFVFSPNSTQVDDYLIEVEQSLERELGRHLLE